jgi:HEAT repeat protein
MGPSAKSAVPALVAIIGDSDQEVRAKAIEALSSIDRSADAARPALEVIAKFAPLTDANTKEAMTAFNALPEGQRARSFEFLATLGETGSPYLLAGFRDNNREVRAAAARAMPVQELVKLLQHKDVALRTESAKTLTARGPDAKEAVAPLATAMQDKFPAVRTAASQALAAIGKPAVPDLIRLLKSGDTNVRSRSAWALGKIGPDAKEAIPALTQAAKDPEASVWTEAREAIIKIQGK